MQAILYKTQFNCIGKEQQRIQKHEKGEMETERLRETERTKKKKSEKKTYQTDIFNGNGLPIISCRSALFA